MSDLPKEIFKQHSPITLDPTASLRPSRECDHELLRTRSERPHNPAVCDRFARPCRLRHSASVLFARQWLTKRALQISRQFRVAAQFAGSAITQCIGPSAPAQGGADID